MPAAGAAAATFTVNSTADQGDAAAGDGVCETAAGNGVCTLRAAIQEANAFAGTDTIVFAIAGPGPYTIAVSPALPIINQPLILDAQTQPGWTIAGPIVRVDGAAAPAAAAGLRVGPNGDDSVIRGLMITRFGSDGIGVASGADRITIAGNWIGTTGTGSTGVGNGDDGLDLGGSLARIGGPNAADRNVITNSTDEGIDIVGSGVSGNVIQGNFIGVDPDGASGNGNGDVGIAVISGTGNTIGGLSVAERNVISRNFEGIEINTANNVVQGNYIGTDVTGTLARGSRSDDGIEIQNGASGNTIGGTATGAGNLIAFNALQGVNVVSGSGNAVLGNSIHSNGNLGIDLLNNGVTPNDGATTAGQPNLLMDFPVITSASLAGTSLAVSGYVGTAAGQATFANARVELFGSDSDPSGNGEGRTYLGFLSTSATNGNFSGTLDVAGKGLAPGDRITATATNATNNTSEFGPNVVLAVGVGGAVFEDVAGDGLPLGQAIGDAANPGRGGAVVRLYLDNGNGVPDAGDALTSTATTAAGGAFVLTPGAAGTYWVVADSKLVTPSAGIRVGFTQGDVWAEQTWGAAGARCSDGAGGTVERGTAGACYGGRAGSLSDNATGLNTPEHVTRLAFSGAAVTGVDFGFSFNVVTNERAGDGTDDDALANRTVQGSLRQFVQNANAVIGANPMRFVPATATNTSAGGGSWWRISFTVALPPLTDPGTTIDGRAYAFADGATVRDQNPGVLGAGGTVGVDALPLLQVARPEMEIIDVGTLLAGIDVRANAATIRRIAIWGFGTLPSTPGHANILIGDGLTGALIEENVIGGGASSFSGQAFSSSTNIRSEGADLGIVRNNLIGFSSSEGFHGAAGTTGWTIEGNEIRVNPCCGGYLFGNGIDVGSAGSGGFTIRGNLITQHNRPNIETASGAGGHTIENNTLTLGGQAGGFDSGIRLDGAGNRVDRNVIRDNSGAGVLVMSGSTGNTITRNSIFANGKIGIDLLSATDSQSTGTAPFVTANDAGDGDAGGNGLLNFPVLVSALATGGLTVGTFSLDVAAGSYRVEFFKNPSGADPSGHGEGQVFAGSTVVTHPGGGSRFFGYSFAGGLGDIVTATATFCTDGAACTALGSTSEFGNALTAATTAVKLMSFEAVAWDGAVELRWRTGSELDNLGFHLYRGPSAGGPWTRLTSSLIPGLGSSPIGQSYAWVDRGLKNGQRYYYRLEDVDTRSVSTFHGPVSAMPVADAEAPPSDVGGGGSSGATGAALECPSWVLASLGTEPSPLVCTKHGDPEAVSLDVLSLDERGATLELRTGGFWAVHTQAGEDALSGTGAVSGTVRVLVPGFDTPTEPSAPALPLRRALVAAVVGKKVRLVSAEARELQGFAGLRPSAVGVPEMAVSRDGTVRASRRAVAARGFSRGYLPQEVARLGGTVFQGETKSAVVEMTPVRFDGYRQRLVLAGRVRVRLAFTGREGEETGAGSKGRLGPRKATPFQEVLAQLHTSRRGLHAVSFEDLFPSRQRGISASGLRLQRQGQAAGFHVEPPTGVFGPGSTLYFFADKTASSTDYASEVAWELVTSSAGVTMAVVPRQPEGGPSSSSTMGLATFETNRSYQPGLLEAPDVWLWEVAVGGGPAPTVSLAISGIDKTSAQPALLTLDLQGGSESGSVENHHVLVSLNGAVVGEGRFAGKKPHRLDLSVPASQLVEGANTLSLHNVGDMGVYSLVFLDKVSVSYPQGRMARAGVFEGTWAEGGTVEVGGVAERPVVLDVTLAGVDGAADVAGSSAVKWVTGFETTPGSVRFRAEAGHSYAVISHPGLLAPRVERPAPSTLRDGANQADYLLIAPRELLGAAEPLLARRESQGLTTKAVAFEEIAEVFGQGQPSAEAIRDFVSYAYHSWRRPSPRYVVLLGDATSDPRRFLSRSSPSPLPALMTKTSYLWTVSDPALAAVNGEDRVPDLAIGRLPAQTVAEAEALVSKLLAWEDSGQDLAGKAVLVADDPDVAGDFEADVEDIHRSFLMGRTTEILKLRELGPSTREAIRAAFDGGASLVSYVGHGAAAVWASENVWNSWDPPSLLAQSRQPLLLTMNCLNGYFLAPSFNSLSEALLKVEGRGVVGAFSPSSLSLDGPAHQYHRAVVAELTGGEHERLGDAILAAQRTYAETGLMPELLAAYQLLGDPAMSIR